ncbi:hypothetical protein IFM89_002758 [Coptis chinensis]|uniref:DUF4283 domain-containing protein n=1 Tax=Coptis chinensis TaxID=261450 RepID=A0A835HTL6_9MAGN|nr:hypothetical protein IFM89_002758 [Coptis chinensis]
MASTPLGFGLWRKNRVFFYGDSLTQGGRNNVIASLATPVDAPSYAAVTSTRLEQTFDLSKILIPSTKGDKLAIKIPLKAIEKGIEACKHVLVGRLDMQVSTLEAIKAEVYAKWGLSGKVKLIPMGKGFVLFKMDNEAYFNRKYVRWTMEYCR